MRPLDITSFRPVPSAKPAPLPGLDRLANRLAGACAAGLATVAPVGWRIVPDAITENARLPAEHDGVRLRFESERGSLTVVLMFDRPGAAALLEVALGGTGSESAVDLADRPLSKIERRLLELAYRPIAEQMAVALGEANGRRFSLFSGADEPELEAESSLVQLRLVMNVFGYCGEICLVFERGELLHQLVETGVEESPLHNSSERHLLQQEMGRSEAILTVTLGRETMTIEAMSGLCPGRHIGLNATVSAPVTLWCGNVAAYRGVLGRNGERFAVTITEAI